MLSFFSNIFGYILNFIYEFVQNYGLSIIIFSILLKLLLLPLSIKQQKTMRKTSKIQGKVKEIQEKYKNDPEKMNREMLDLYKNENMSPFSGCLSSIIQILLLFSIFYLVRSPLTYMKKIDTTDVNNMKSYIQQEVDENAISKTYPEISIVKYISKIKNGEVLNNNEEDKEENKEGNIVENNEESIQENKEENIIENIIEIEENEEKIELSDEIIEKAYINMNFLGLDLSNVPTENKENLNVFIIPLLYVVTSIVSMRISTKIGKNKKEKTIEISEENDKKEEPDMTAQMNKSMSLFMPIMSVAIALVAPLGLALYWLINNILMILERIILNKILDSKEEKENV